MKVAVLVAALAGTLLNASVFARSGSEVLEDMREDARRDTENSVRGEVYKRFPHSGSLYGLPGQTRSDSIRESAIRAAIGGVFGSCKAGGKVDLGKLPGGFNMNVEGILANTAITVPDVKLPTSSVLTNQANSLIPQPTQLVNGQVKVGGQWMPLKDYQQMVAQTQAALQNAAQQQVTATAQSAIKDAAKDVPQTIQKPVANVPVSSIWKTPAKAPTQ